MAISKKLKISREHKKAEAAGTRVPVKANGIPVKKPTEQIQCTFCKKEVPKKPTPIEEHGTMHKNMTPQTCFPSYFAQAVPS